VRRFIPPQDIIFDLNIFPVATGMEEHRLNTLISLEEPSGSPKFTHISGGVSNVSFSDLKFWLKRYLGFLYHTKEQMTMGIVNLEMLSVMMRFENLLEHEDVILDRRRCDKRLLDFDGK
jgi:5-methyltetrahydrofolate--homocysteine methyltransferase